MIRYLILILILAGTVSATDWGYADTSMLGVSGILQTEDTLEGPRYTCPVSDSESLDSIYGYISADANFDMRACLYKLSDSSVIDSAYERLSVNTSGNRQWVGFEFIGKATVYADTAYVLQFWSTQSGPKTCGLAYVAPDASATYSRRTGYGYTNAWPEPPNWAAGYTNIRFYGYVKSDAFPPAATGPPNALHDPSGTGQLHGPNDRSYLTSP